MIMRTYQSNSKSSIVAYDKAPFRLMLVAATGLSVLNPMFSNGSGTGDNLSPGLKNGYSEIQSSNVFTMSNSQVQRIQVLDVRTTVAHLENIRQTLDLPMSDLANVFGVSRQMVYKWIDGAQPEEKPKAKIVDLSQIVDALVEAKVQHVSNLIKMKLFDGHSLLEIVREGKGWKEPVKQLIAEARAMESSYAQSGITNSKAKPTNDWMLDQSIPHLISVVDD